MTQATTLRDYAADMQIVIDKATEEPRYVPALVAARIVADLRDRDPDLLNGWLHAQAESFVREAVTKRDRSIRAHARHAAPGRAFAQAAERHQAGDHGALKSYLEIPFTVADGSHPTLGSLMHDDLLFVRDNYQRRVNENAFYVTLMDTLAKKVTTGTVADHYTEEQIAAMFRPLGV